MSSRNERRQIRQTAALQRQGASSPFFYLYVEPLVRPVLLFLIPFGALYGARRAGWLDVGIDLFPAGRGLVLAILLVFLFLLLAFLVRAFLRRGGWI